MELKEFDQETIHVCASVAFGNACMTKMAISVDHVESRSCAVMLGGKEITLGEIVHLLNSYWGGLRC